MIIEAIAFILLGAGMYLFGCAMGEERGVNKVRKEYEEKMAHYVHEVKIDANLNEVERTKLKEVRLMQKGYQQCPKCRRVTGMYYLYSDGKLRGITLVKTKSLSGEDILVCTDCLNRIEGEVAASGFPATGES